MEASEEEILCMVSWYQPHVQKSALLLEEELGFTLAFCHPESVGLTAFRCWLGRKYGEGQWWGRKAMFGAV